MPADPRPCSWLRLSTSGLGPARCAVADVYMASAWRRCSVSHGRKRLPRASFLGGPRAGIRLPSDTRRIRRGRPAFGRDPCHLIRTGSPVCYDHAIHLKLSRRSSSIHTRAHELEILNVPKLPVKSREGAPVEGWRERGFRRPAASPRASHSTSTALSSPRSSSSASGLPAGGLHLCGSLG